MEAASSRIFSGLGYAYLAAFFLLLAGLFHTLITGANSEKMVGGVLALFLGVAGGALLYGAATRESQKGVMAGAGLAFVALSLYAVFAITGRG